MPSALEHPMPHCVVHKWIEPCFKEEGRQLIELLVIESFSGLTAMGTRKNERDWQDKIGNL